VAAALGAAAVVCEVAAFSEMAEEVEAEEEGGEEEGAQRLAPFGRPSVA
jgi:hypothetical protein